MDFSNARLLTVELAVNNDDFELSNFDNVIQVRSKDIMFHKERLLNLGIDILIKNGYKNIAWLDADILFENINWQKNIIDALKNNLVVQVFENVHIQSSFYDSGKFFESAAALFHFKKSVIFPLQNPGFGWAGRSEIFNSIRLYDKAILGDNDTLLFYSFFYSGKNKDLIKNAFAVNCLSRLLKADFLKYAESMGSIVKGRVGFAKQDISTFYHGDLKNRKYIDRKKMYKLYDFDPFSDLKDNSCRCFEWAGSKKKFHSDVNDYFFGMREE